MTYQDAVAEWVRRQDLGIDDGAAAFDFKVEHNSGFAYSSWTYEDGYVSIVLTYQDVLGRGREYELKRLDDDRYSFGNIVREITAIAAGANV